MLERDRIVIGASAGGLSALQQLVAQLPADLPAAIFITLHMPEQGGIFLPDVLNRAGPLRAEVAKDNAVIQDGRIYVAPVDHHLLLMPDGLRISHGPREGLQRPSINVMFRSAAAAFGDRVAGVVLTGMLDDGAAGLWEIQQKGGVTVVQDPEEAAYRSMPESAIRGLNVQYILRLDEIAHLMTRLGMGERRDSNTPQNTYPADAALPGPALTRQACPECGGVMTVEQLGTIKEYICHVGHRLGIQSMISAKTDVVERTMWKALSQSEELIELLEQAQENASPPEDLRSEIARRRRDMEGIRRLLQRNDLDAIRED
jgi:two-component system chemotaxis response regulator CheB